MSYYVTTEGRDNVTLFLIDRRISKKHWWTMSLTKAMEFREEATAKAQARKLIYKSPRVVGEVEAKRLEDRNDFLCAELEEHPFSSEAIGQE